MVTCPCGCHDGFQRPCTVADGCGHLHRATGMDRPDSACRSCRPPRGTNPWRLAPSGYTACESCRDTMEDNLDEIQWRYYLLNPRPGSSGDLDHRGSPGFGSRSPASDHVIVMRDGRSSHCARVWVGSDGRVHREPEKPPLSVYSVLLTEAVDTAERRVLSDRSEFESVLGLTVFLTRHIDWWGTQRDVGEFAGKLRRLVSQLRPVTGTPHPKPFARCPNTIDLGDGTRTCGGPLFAPVSLAVGVIECVGCGREWERPEWDEFGQLLRSA